MHFSLLPTQKILERTPYLLNLMLGNLSDEWTNVNEGGETWSVFDIVGHLIHGEKTDWIPRMEIILSDLEHRTFEPYDRFAQFENSKGKTLVQLLEEFTTLRQQNLEHLRSKNLSNLDFQKTGKHPVFGDVTLSQLLSTWMVHDLNHLAQISRVIARQYTQEVGPWIEYLSILKK